jgi:DNA-binding transcriptional MerR regulator
VAKRRTSENPKAPAGKAAAARALGIKQVAADLGVSAKWIRGQVAQGTVAPKRAGGKGNGRFLFTPEDLEALRLAKEAEPPAGEETTAIARISRLEADRTNLLAQVAWARAVAQEQQKALEIERERAEKLAAELEAQRTRIERLKALSALDRLLGRHKAI